MVNLVNADHQHGYVVVKYIISNTQCVYILERHADKMFMMKANKFYH